jgi:hypothetical protein
VLPCCACRCINYFTVQYTIRTAFFSEEPYFLRHLYNPTPTRGYVHVRFNHSRTRGTMNRPALAHNLTWLNCTKQRGQATIHPRVEERQRCTLYHETSRCWVLSKTTNPVTHVITYRRFFFTALPLLHQQTHKLETYGQRSRDSYINPQDR